MGSAKIFERIAKIEKKIELMELKEIKKDKNFRVNSRSIFLTYSKIDKKVSKELIREEIVKLFESKNQGLSGLAIAQEKHTDGTYHFHVLLYFSRRIDTENPRYFDILGYHPHFSSTRNEEKTLLYLTKEDKEVYIDDYVRTKFFKYDECVLYVLDKYFSQGYGPEVTIEQLGYYGYRNRSKIAGWYKAWFAGRLAKAELSKPGWPAIDLAVLKKYLPAQVYKIFLTASRASKLGIPRPFKSLHLFIWSTRPNTGKTSFTRYFQQKLSSFNFPTDAWWDGYHDKRYQLLSWNEVDFSKWRFTDLNLFLEGSAVYLPIKGAKTLKTDNPLVIGTSNFSLRHITEERAKKLRAYDETEVILCALRARIVEWEIKGDVLFKLLDELKASDKRKKISQA